MAAVGNPFPAVGKNGKSIIVTGLTDFAMMKTLKPCCVSVPLKYPSLFHTTPFSIFTKQQRHTFAIGQPPPPL